MSEVPRAARCIHGVPLSGEECLDCAGETVPEAPLSGSFDCPHCGAKLAIEKPAGASIQQSRINWTPDPRVHEGWFGDDPV